MSVKQIGKSQSTVNPSVFSMKDEKQLKSLMKNTNHSIKLNKKENSFSPPKIFTIKPKVIMNFNDNLKKLEDFKSQMNIVEHSNSSVKSSSNAKSIQTTYSKALDKKDVYSNSFIPQKKARSTTELEKGKELNQTSISNSKDMTDLVQESVRTDKAAFVVHVDRSSQKKVGENLFPLFNFFLCCRSYMC